MQRPIVGLTTYCQEASFGSWDHVESVIIQRAYTNMIEKAGARVILLSPPEDPSLIDDFIYHDLFLIDALVFSGGSDIEPSFYGEEKSAKTGRCYPKRDEYEISLAKKAYLIDIPTLGICRGNQVINVALGGSLYQDLSEIYDGINHSTGNDGDRFHKTEITIAKDSFLQDILGDQEIVSCRHHQAINRLGDGLIPVGFSESGKIIEAVVGRDKKFFVGVQWHPEQDEDVRIFKALIESVN